MRSISLTLLALLGAAAAAQQPDPHLYAPPSADRSPTSYACTVETLLTGADCVFEGQAPPGDPWPWYVFRGVSDPAVFKGGMEKNIILIYEYQKKLRY